MERVTEWAWKKRKQGLSWVTVKNILRTMQRVLTSSSKDQKVLFSQDGLAIPEKDKLRMRIESRENVSYYLEQALQIVEHIKTMDILGATRREQYRHCSCSLRLRGCASVNCSRYARMTSARTQFASMNPWTEQALSDLAKMLRRTGRSSLLIKKDRPR